ETVPSSTSAPTELPKLPKLDLDEFVPTALLWHQLTLKLYEFFDHPLSRPLRVNVFEQFIFCQDPQGQLLFLNSILSRIGTETSQEAYVLLLAKPVYGELEGTKTDMDTAWTTLNQLEGVDTAVNASYYKVATDYCKSKAEYAPYYKHSLLYLACVDVATDRTSEERLLRAHDLGISAFLGDTIYNLWECPILEENYPFLRQKICLMALIESVFKRNANDLMMSFQTIAEETRPPVDEVEHLIMKALGQRSI
ncbi:hypothetical protein CY34DRAFT_805142, partial [Suillus luteus UH-Slu-Lm8-n1]